MFLQHIILNIVRWLGPIIFSVFPRVWPLGVGGVRQYIHQQYPVAAARAGQLGKLLGKLVPRLDDVTYQDSFPIPACLSGYLDIV